MLLRSQQNDIFFPFPDFIAVTRATYLCTIHFKDSPQSKYKSNYLNIKWNENEGPLFILKCFWNVKWKFKHKMLHCKRVALIRSRFFLISLLYNSKSPIFPPWIQLISFYFRSIVSDWINSFDNCNVSTIENGFLFSAIYLAIFTISFQAITLKRKQIQL